MLTLFVYAISIFIALPLLFAIGFLLWPTLPYRVRQAEYHDSDLLPGEISELFQPWIDRLIELDFEVVSYQIFHDDIIGEHRYAPYWAAIFQHSSQQIFASLTAITMLKNRDLLVCGLSSYWQNYKLVTTNIPNNDIYSQSPLHKVNYRDRADIDELWTAHQDFINSFCSIESLERMTFTDWASAVDRETHEIVELRVKRNELQWVDRQQQIYRFNRWIALKTVLKFIFDKIAAKQLKS
jgi:hypothetical protein